MKSRANWALLLAGCGGWWLALAAAPATAAPQTAGKAPVRSNAGLPTDYQPSTGERPGEIRYDEVGYAAVQGDAAGTEPVPNPIGMSAAHVTLPVPSFAEVTALDNGKTVLVRIDGRSPSAPGRIIELSREAAQALGIDQRVSAGVRVRAVRPLPADAAALSSGRAVARADAPTPVLVALRRKLPPAAAVATPPRAAPPRVALTRAPAAQPGRAVTGKYLVQVAALASQERARAIAQRLRGRVVPAGNLHRIQLGPFADAAGARRARAEAARAGFGDARVIPSR